MIFDAANVDGFHVSRWAANELQGKLEELGQGELDVEVIARAVVEHTARALDKTDELTDGETQAGSEQLGPRKPDVTSIDASTNRENAAFRRPLFDTHIVVDWSARGKPGPVKSTKDGIWWAAARIDDGSVSVPTPEYTCTRDDALRRLICLIADELNINRQVLIGFDFPFGYPRGVAEHLIGEASALALWDWLPGRIKDEPNNANNCLKSRRKSTKPTIWNWARAGVVRALGPSRPSRTGSQHAPCRNHIREHVASPRTRSQRRFQCRLDAS